MTAFHAMKAPELSKVIQETERTLAEYLINRYSKQSKNVHEGTAMRRKIAVIKTLLNQKEMKHD